MGKLTRNFKKYLTDLDTAVKRGVSDWEEVLKEAAMEYTPKDTGALRGSYLASIEPTSGRYGVRYLIKFGNELIGAEGKNYAAEVHEWPDDKNWTTPGTGPRFLERALWENADRLIGAVKNSCARLK